MSMLRAFDEEFHTSVKDRESLLPITEFAGRWCGQTLTLAQRVILKLYAGEVLLESPQPGYALSERGWLDQMIDRGRFPRDVRQRLDENLSKGFKSILLVIGRRGGKSMLVAVAALYTIHKVLQHDNPQEHWGMQENDIIQVAVCATSAAQSERSPFQKIIAICKHAIDRGLPLARWLDEDGIKQRVIYFKSLHDVEVERNLRRRGVDQRNATVQIHAYHSNVDTLRGGSIIAAIFDEFAQFKVTQRGVDLGDYFYSSLAASVLQFGDDGRTFILSTPQGEMGKFHELYLETWRGVRPGTIGVHMPSWEMWEDEPPERADQGITRYKMAASDDIPFYWNPEVESFEEAWMRAPTSVKVEFGAEFHGSDEQWLPSILIVNPKPGKGFRDERLKHVTQGTIGRVYIAHADAASKTDAFALAVVHREPDPEGDRIVVDHAVRWYVAPSLTYEERPYEFVKRQTGAEPAHIYFKDVKDYIKTYVLGRFNVAMFTMDQYQSHEMIEDLSEHIYNKGQNTVARVVPFTQAFNKKRADNFETLILEDRIKCYPHDILEEELRGLQKDRFGKVEKGPVTNDDLYDAVSTAALHAMELPAMADESHRGYAFGIEPGLASVRM